VISFILTSTLGLRLDRNVPARSPLTVVEHADPAGRSPDRQSAHRSGPSQGRGGRWSAACTATARPRARTAASARGGKAQATPGVQPRSATPAAPANKTPPTAKSAARTTDRLIGFALDLTAAVPVGDNFAHGLTISAESKRIISTALAPIAVAFRTRRSTAWRAPPRAAAYIRRSRRRRSIAARP